eukprot:GGOE01021010.1.p1 GENE.GGOE01021010.1~~GGOE01021010.1.p1  ORF type:complete len:368 (+),score=63.75 GGOE01021010.1:348-1451(+)
MLFCLLLGVSALLQQQSKKGDLCGRHWWMAAVGDVGRNHYATLGITKEASSADIKRAYRCLALKYHPDVNPGVVAQQMFRTVSEAYKVLSDPEQRQFYDASHANPSTRFPGTGTGSISPSCPTSTINEKAFYPCNPFPSAKVVKRFLRNQQAEGEVKDSWSALFSDLLEEFGAKAVEVSEQESFKKAMKSSLSPSHMLENLIGFLESRQHVDTGNTDWYEEFMGSLKNVKVNQSTPRTCTRPPPVNLWAGGKVPLSATLSCQDLYQVLGVPRSATAEQIQHTYRKKIRGLEPEITSSLEAQRLYHIFEEAYKVLAVPSRRQEYDMSIFWSSKKPQAEVSTSSTTAIEEQLDTQLMELKEKMKLQGKL